MSALGAIANEKLGTPLEQGTDPFRPNTVSGFPPAMADYLRNRACANVEGLQTTENSSSEGRQR